MPSAYALNPAGSARAHFQPVQGGEFSTVADRRRYGRMVQGGQDLRGTRCQPTQISSPPVGPQLVFHLRCAERHGGVGVRQGILRGVPRRPLGRSRGVAKDQAVVDYGPPARGPAASCPLRNPCVMSHFHAIATSSGCEQTE